jgi:hypothetical protein
MGEVQKKDKMRRRSLYEKIDTLSIVRCAWIAAYSEITKSVKCYPRIIKHSPFCTEKSKQERVLD